MEQIKAVFAVVADVYDWFALLVADHPRIALALMLALAIIAVF